MFVKATNGEIVQFPYTIGQLRRDNPHTSFPKTISAETLAAHGVYETKHLPAPSHDPQTHFVEYPNVPVLLDGAWVFPASVVELSAEQIAQKVAEISSVVRKERDDKLAATDWRVIKAYETSSNIPAEWELYRQALRDITTQVGFPHTVEWPVEPV